MTNSMCTTMFLVAMLLALTNTASAQFGVGWMKIPEIVVVGRADDPRQSLVDEAVDFWNKMLAELGSPFRLDKVTRHVGVVPGAVERMMTSSRGTPTAQFNLRFHQYVPVILCGARRREFVSPPPLWRSSRRSAFAASRFLR